MIHCYKDYNQALIGLKRLNHIIPHNNPNLSNTLTLENHNGVPMLHFRKLKDFPWLYQGFSTRIGGVSSGIYESMNLSFNLLDSKEKVLNNFKIVSDTIGIPVEYELLNNDTRRNMERDFLKELKAFSPNIKRIPAPYINEDEEIMESQAIGIAPRILMPRDAFIEVAGKYDIVSEDVSWKEIADIARFFDVSKQSVKIRLKECGIL